MCGDKKRPSEYQGWIFSWVTYSLRLVISNLAYVYANVLKYFIECFSKVAEYNGSVVWKAFFDEPVAVESALCKTAGGRCSIAERL